MLRTFSGQAGPLREVSFSPDGTQLVSAGADRLILVWDIGSSQQVGVLSGHQDIVWDVDFDLTGTHLVSASDDGTLRIWLTDVQALLGLAKARVQREPPVLTLEERERFRLE
jgi:WD40 repeat protein